MSVQSFDTIRHPANAAKEVGGQVCEANGLDAVSRLGTEMPGVVPVLGVLGRKNLLDIHNQNTVALTSRVAGIVALGMLGVNSEHLGAKCTAILAVGYTAVRDIVKRNRAAKAQQGSNEQQFTERFGLLVEPIASRHTSRLDLFVYGVAEKDVQPKQSLLALCDLAEAVGAEQIVLPEDVGSRLSSAVDMVTGKTTDHGESIYLPEYLRNHSICDLVASNGADPVHMFRGFQPAELKKMLLTRGESAADVAGSAESPDGLLESLLEQLAKLPGHPLTRLSKLYADPQAKALRNQALLRNLRYAIGSRADKSIPEYMPLKQITADMTIQTSDAELSSSRVSRHRFIHTSPEVEGATVSLCDPRGPVVERHELDIPDSEAIEELVERLRTGVHITKDDILAIELGVYGLLTGQIEGGNSKKNGLVDQSNMIDDALSLLAANNQPTVIDRIVPNNNMPKDYRLSQNNAPRIYSAMAALVLVGSGLLGANAYMQNDKPEQQKAIEKMYETALTNNGGDVLAATFEEPIAAIVLAENAVASALYKPFDAVSDGTKKVLEYVFNSDGSVTPTTQNVHVESWGDTPIGNVEIPETTKGQAVWKIEAKQSVRTDGFWTTSVVDVSSPYQASWSKSDYAKMISEEASLPRYEFAAKSGHIKVQGVSSVFGVGPDNSRLLRIPVLEGWEPVSAIVGNNPADEVVRIQYATGDYALGAASREPYQQGKTLPVTFWLAPIHGHSQRFMERARVYNDAENNVPHRIRDALGEQLPSGKLAANHKIAAEQIEKLTRSQFDYNVNPLDPSDGSVVNQLVGAIHRQEAICGTAATVAALATGENVAVGYNNYDEDTKTLTVGEAHALNVKPDGSLRDTTPSDKDKNESLDPRTLARKARMEKIMKGSIGANAVLLGLGMGVAAYRRRKKGYVSTRIKSASTEALTRSLVLAETALYANPQTASSDLARMTKKNHPYHLRLRELGKPSIVKRVTSVATDAQKLPSLNTTVTHADRVTRRLHRKSLRILKAATQASDDEISRLLIDALAKDAIRKQRHERSEQRNLKLKEWMAAISPQKRGPDHGEPDLYEYEL